MTQPLIVALPTHAGDIEQAETLMKWMVELGPMREHSLLVGADAGIPQERVKALLDVARPAFHSVRAMIIQTGAKGWPLAANLMFRAVARQIYEGYKLPWLWVEPDCVPLRAGWLDDLAGAYRLCPRPLMGHVIDNPDAPEGLPKRYVSGIAVYPQDLFGLLSKRWQEAKFTGPTSPVRRPGQREAPAVGAWDMTFADTLTPRAHHTPLIQSHWGTAYSTPPVFKTLRTEADPANVVTLDFIKREAAIFHRVKETEDFLTMWRVGLEHRKALAVEALKPTGASAYVLDKALEAGLIEAPKALPTATEPAPTQEGEAVVGKPGEANPNFKGGDTTLAERRKSAAQRSKEYQEEAKRKAQQQATKQREPMAVI